MIKRAFSCLVVFALLVVSAQFVRAEKSVKYDELSICRRVFAYSGNSSAYFYGFYEKTICSARVVPDDSARKATVSGNVLAVCHDEDNLCALYSSGYEKFGAARLNINSGRLYYREIVSGKNVQFSSIAEADGELFLIIVENGVSFVTGYTELRLPDLQATGLTCIHSPVPRRLLFRYRAFDSRRIFLPLKA